MITFRKFAAASNGKLIRMYFTEAKPAPVAEQSAEAANRQLEPGNRLTDYYAGGDGSPQWRRDMPLSIARALGVNPHAPLKNEDLDRLAKDAAGGLVLALMVTPVIAAMSREVLLGVDPRLRHSVVALGGSDWDVMRVALWPSARTGLAGAGLLGLARAMGETIALALVLGGVSAHATGSTLAASIVLRFSSAGPAGRDALVAVGLTLFVITVAVTGAARTLLRRSTLTRGVV